MSIKKEETTDTIKKVPENWWNTKIGVTDAASLVGPPGVKSQGKIDPLSGEVLSNEEFSKRQGEREAVMGIDQQIATLEATAAAMKKPETPEEKAKRERQEKSKRIIAGVSDGLAALTNLFFASRYAPSSYTPQNSQLGKVNEWIDKSRAEREAEADRYNSFMLRLGNLQAERAKTLRDLKAQHEAQKLAREKAQREAEAHSWLAALQHDKQREQAGKANKAEFDAIAAHYEAENKPQELQLKNDTETARAESYRASATASYASAAAHNRSNPYEFTAWDEYGNPHTFNLKEAADRFAKQHGTYQETEQSETTHTTGKSASGRNVDQTATKTTKGGYPAKPIQSKGKGYGKEAGKGKGY